ncbi:cytochrome c oxidase subunit 2A [Chloroflexota bacterium]
MSDKNATEKNEFKPKGTLVILGIFLITLIVLWGTVYIILLNRGVTI